MPELNYWAHARAQRFGRRQVLRGTMLGTAGLAAAALIGCSGGGKPAANAPAAPAAAGQSAPAGPATPKRGGNLVSLKAGAPNGFDPYLTLNWQSIIYSAPVWSQLVRLDPGKTFPLSAADIKPDLAERWEMSPDGRVMTFFLRKGVKFSNGTPFTSKDAKFSIQRMADPKINYFSGELKQMESVETPDDFTVQVKWKVPSAGKLATFASGYSVIMSADHASTKDRKKEEFAMGTGPFRLASFQSGQEYRYERNADYYLKDKPYLDSMVFKVVTSDAQLSGMVSGQGDVPTWVKGGVSTEENAKQIESQAVKTLKIWKDMQSPRPLGRGMFFNMKAAGPWQSPDVRRALSLVVEQETVLAKYGQGWALPNTWFLPGMALSLDEFKSAMGWNKPIGERVTEAKALMARAGFANGFKETVVVRNSNEYVENATLVIEAWKKHLNVEAKLDTPELAIEVDRRQKHDYKIMFYLITLRTGIHPSEVAPSFITGSLENWAQYSNPELDDAFAKMDGLLSGPELTALAKKANTIIAKDAPGIPTIFNIDYPVTKPDVKGVVSHPWLTNEDYSTIWLDR